MCLQAKKSFPELDVEVPLKFSLYVLDEIGKITDNYLSSLNDLPIVASYSRGQTSAFRELCEDG